MPCGAADAWNRQCAGTVFAEKSLMPGDRIVSINGVTGDPNRMLEECRERRLLKLMVSRSTQAPLPASPTFTAVGSNAETNATPLTEFASAADFVAPAQAPRPGLRADAAEFVPFASAEVAEEAASAEDTARRRWVLLAGEAVS
jgi:hypothetical protein